MADADTVKIDVEERLATSRTIVTKEMRGLCFCAGFAMVVLFFVMAGGFVST